MNVLRCCRGLSVNRNMKVFCETAVSSPPWKWPRTIGVSICVLSVQRERTPCKTHPECDPGCIRRSPCSNCLFLILGEESVTRCGRELSPYGANFCLILWPLLRCRFPDAGACFFSDPSCASPHVGGCWFFLHRNQFVYHRYTPPPPTVSIKATEQLIVMIKVRCKP